MNKTFDEIVLFARTGLNPRKNFVLGNGSNNYITIKNIHNNQIIIDKNTDKVDDDAILKIHKRSQIKKGDILFNSIGRIGDMYIIQDEPRGWDINESVFAFTLDTNLIVQKYFYYIFKNQKTIDYLEKNSSGSTFKSIKMNQLKRMAFDIPSLDKQQEIVSILDKINAIIDADKKQLELLDESVKSRFIEMFGDVLKNDKNWNTQSFKELCREIGDGLHGTPVYDDFGEYYFINGNNLENKSICIKNDTKRVSEEEYKKYFIDLDENTVLISINGTFGKTAFYNNEKIILGKSACYVKLKDELNREFVLNLFGTDAWLRYMDENSSGTTIRNFGLKAMREFKMIVPPLELQNEFATFVEQIDKSKYNIQQHLNLMQELLDKKMEELFGGE